MRLLLVLVALIALVSHSPAQAQEKPQPLDEARLAEIVKAAPPMPGKLDLDLKLRLIDFIDCTSATDPHGFMDQGTSKVAEGPAGKYRVTAAHRHAFFSYRFRAAGKDKPVLLVFEYPDDAQRNICFFTHESGLSGRSNNDWSLETGVYCGEPYPLSNKMQYHTFIFWAQDAWPAALVANWNRYGSSGAASRIWVYAIDAPLPKLDVKEPDPNNPRRLGHYNSLQFLPTRFHFGLGSPKAIEHMLDYAQYVGVNELSWTVMYNNSYGFGCRIPSWGKGDDSNHLDRVLAAMDARGGMAFVAGFSIGDDFRFGGKTAKDMKPEEFKEALFKGFDEFLENYGPFQSLKGISLGAMYGDDAIDPWIKSGLLAEVVGHIKAKRPDLLVETYEGGKGLHIQYFSGRGEGQAKTPSCWDVVSGWETSGEPWSQYLGEAAAAAWKDWGHDPAVLKQAGLTVLEQLQPDDFGIFPLYAQEPRAMMYYDLDRSQTRSDAVASDRAALWNTHYEGWFGLDANTNFWYRKLWVAPDFLPPEPLSMAPFANALALRDRVEIIPGSWNNKYFGHEATVRKWAKAFRELPGGDFADVPTQVDTVRMRQRIEGNTFYVYYMSVIPFPCNIRIDGNDVSLQPYEIIRVQAAPGKGSGFTASEDPSPEYRKFVEGRIADYKKLCAEVKALNAEAVPECYTKVADDAEKLVAAHKLYAADIALGAGLVNEMRLRKALLAPPQLMAPRVDTAPDLKADLDAWPKGASDLKADTGEYLAGHLYFPNSWTGPDDLSIRLRMCNDGTKLYVGAMVRDNVLEKRDGAQFSFSKAAYMDWRGQAQKMDFIWPIDLPLEKDVVEGKGAKGFTYTCRKVAGGYLIEGSAPLADLGVKPGEAIGFLLTVSDSDNTSSQNTATWARKQAMLVPHRPTFEYWSDARNCGRLVIGK
jgi:hypothetical protein